MRHNGQQGYQDAAKEILRAAGAFREAVATIPELQVLGDSAGSIVAFASSNPKAFNIYQVRSVPEIDGSRARQQQEDARFELVVSAVVLRAVHVPFRKQC